MSSSSSCGTQRTKFTGAHSTTQPDRDRSRWSWRNTATIANKGTTKPGGPFVICRSLHWEWMRLTMAALAGAMGHPLCLKRHHELSSALNTHLLPSKVASLSGRCGRPATKRESRRRLVSLWIALMDYGYEACFQDDEFLPAIC